MDLSEFKVWDILVQVGIIFIAIIASNVIRRKVKFIRNSLLPTSVIAGMIIFAFKFVPYINEYINADFMELLTYHCLGIGFIALAMKSSVKKKGAKFAILDTGITTVNGYLVIGGVNN